jgi:2-polyprenyl-3-methyl-5-hydroxy-6-metoxy-1,4-benzoquinol methylase
MTQKGNPNNTSHYRADKIAGYFDEYGMHEWDRLVSTPVDEVSLYIHTHYLKEYVPRGARVLEVGAGAGRFTQVLASLGASILVADISQVQLDLNKEHAQQHGFAHAVENWQQVDICDMRQFGSGSFDFVVAYGGPFSYVLDKRDQAMGECLRLLKCKGVLLLSVMSVWGSVHRYLNGVLGIPAHINRKIIATGDLSPETIGERDNNMHMFRAGEFIKWLKGFNLEVLARSASFCLSPGWEEMLAEMRADEETWDQLLRMELEACAEEGSLNMGTHLIGVARKA